ncbi:L-methionine sulfoximine/L-methionine sulfone acetyltransferase [anaerobic digester metagenome]
MTGCDRPEPVLRDAELSDAEWVVAIINYYASTGFAVFSTPPVPLGFFSDLLSNALSCSVLDEAGLVIGFGCMSPLLPFSAFAPTVLLSLYIAPGRTRQGLGTRLLDHLTAEARALGCQHLVVTVASRNTPSLRFHERHGFAEVGRLKDVGTRFGMPFDLVWLQREL